MEILIIVLAFLLIAFLFANVFSQTEEDFVMMSDELLNESIQTTGLLFKNAELANACLQNYGVYPECVVLNELYQSTMTGLQIKYSQLMNKTETVVLEQLIQNCGLVMKTGTYTVIPDCLDLVREYNDNLEQIITKYQGLRVKLGLTQ